MHDTDRLRSRILLALGATLALPKLVSIGEADTGTDHPVCIAVDSEGECPSAELVMDELQAANGTCTILEVVGPGTVEGDLCCYPVIDECSDAYVYDPCTSCYGRPYVDANGPRRAATMRRIDWLTTDLPAPALDSLTAAQRAALADWWTENARAEHSSVAGFARLAVELMAHGAPAALVDRALVAAREERGHAELCFALASAYAGVPVGPGRLPVGTSAPIAEDLVALAISTAREGAIGETVASHVARGLALAATDPSVKLVLLRIAEEEAAHAELAWATLRWALAVGGDPVRQALVAVLAEGVSAAADAADDPTLVAHGMPAPGQVRALTDEAVARVIRPAAAVLLAASTDPVQIRRQAELSL